MKTATKVWLIIAASLVLMGCIIFGCVMSTLRWDFKKLSTDNYETNTYEISEGYKNVSIIADTADIVFMPSEGSEASVVCYEKSNTKHTVEVKDDTLTVEVVDTRKWYEHIGINIGTQKITVYIPLGEYGTLYVKSSTGDVEIPNDLKFESIDISLSTGAVTSYASASESIRIKTSTGSIYTENISAAALDLSASTGKVTATGVNCEGDISVSVSTGKVHLTDIECNDLSSTGDTGDISLKNTVARGKLSIDRSTGDVKLDASDAAEIYIETDTGDVVGSLLTDKVFITETDTGRVDVPNTQGGGNCEIITDTGDIKIEIK